MISEAWRCWLLDSASAGLPALLWLAGRACRSGRANDYWLACWLVVWLVGWWHVERTISDLGCSHPIYKICQCNVSYIDLE